MKRLVFFFVVILTMWQNAYADNYDFVIYTQTIEGDDVPLYYRLFNNAVVVTYPNYNGYYLYFSRPTGSIIIPDSVSYDDNTYYDVIGIDGYAFAGCTGLTSITIPSTITYIGHYAFNGCTGLSSITIPSSVTSIYSSAFDGCNNLANVNYLGTMEQWLDLSFGDSKANPIYYSHSLNINNEPISDLVIPDGVLEIKNYAFINSHFSSVEMSNTITSIGNSAFSGCTNLHSISIPSSVTSIGSNAFYDCGTLDSIFLFPFYPPTLGLNAFLGPVGFVISQTRTFHIPCGSGMYYQSLWGNYFSLYQFKEPGVDFDFLLFSDNTTQGTTSVSQHYGINVSCLDSSIIINATPLHGYHLDHWSNGNTANPDTLYLSGDSTVTAFFEPNIYNVVGIANDSARGTVTGSCSAVYLDSITLTATANYGFHFLYWYDNSLHIYYPENPLKVAATDNITMTAIFDYNQYSITLSADTSIHGSVIGAGSFNYLSQRTIRANANYGYHFTQWNDGNTDNPRVIVLAKDTSFTAIYERNEYILSFQSADTTKGIVNVVSIPGLYLDTTPYITATALPHYHFTQWSDGSTENPRQFVFNNNNTYIASFDIDVHTVSVNVDNLAHGTVQGGGNFTYGTPATVSATSYSGYQFTHWSDGSTYNPYTFAVLEDKILTAVFMADGEPWQDTVIIYDTAYVILHDTAYTSVLIHDTTYIDVFVHDTTSVPVHDTTYINIHDTTYITLTDTVTNTLYDTITNTVYDTTIVYSTDTLWLHDTVFVHDTIFIYDTIYVGVDDVETISAKIYTSNGQIVVDGAEGNTVWLYDINGRILATKQDEYSPLRFDVSATGTYLVKIGDHPARKVVVIR